MNTEAFFSDTSENYCIPAEPDPGQAVRVRFRASKEEHLNVDFVSAESGEASDEDELGFSAARYFHEEIRVLWAMSLN